MGLFDLAAGGRARCARHGVNKLNIADSRPSLSTVQHLASTLSVHVGLPAWVHKSRRFVVHGFLQGVSTARREPGLRAKIAVRWAHEKKRPFQGFEQWGPERRGPELFRSGGEVETIGTSEWAIRFTLSEYIAGSPPQRPCSGSGIDRHGRVS